MHRFRRCCAPLALLLIASCSAEPRAVFQVPDVPADLRRPCPGVSLAAAVTEGQHSDADIANARALACANAHIAAIDEILSLAEGRPR